MVTLSFTPLRVAIASWRAYFSWFLLIPVMIIASFLTPESNTNLYYTYLGLVSATLVIGGKHFHTRDNLFGGSAPFYIILVSWVSYLASFILRYFPTLENRLSDSSSTTTPTLSSAEPFRYAPFYLCCLFVASRNLIWIIASAFRMFDVNKVVRRLQGIHFPSPCRVVKEEEGEGEGEEEEEEGEGEGEEGETTKVTKVTKPPPRLFYRVLPGEFVPVDGTISEILRGNAADTDTDADDVQSQSSQATTTTIDASYFGMDSRVIKTVGDGVIGGSVNGTESQGGREFIVESTDGPRGLRVAQKTFLRKGIRRVFGNKGLRGAPTGGEEEEEGEGKQQVKEIGIGSKGFDRALGRIETYLIFLVCALVMFFATIWYFLFRLDIVSLSWFASGDEAKAMKFDFLAFLIFSVLSLLMSFYPMSWSRLAFQLAIGRAAELGCLFLDSDTVGKLRETQLLIMDLDGILFRRWYGIEKVLFVRNSTVYLQNRDDLLKLVAEAMIGAAMTDDPVGLGIISYVLDEGLVASLGEILENQTIVASERRGERGVVAVQEISGEHFGIIVGERDFVVSQGVDISAKLDATIQQAASEVDVALIVAIGTRVVGSIFLKRSPQKLDNLRTMLEFLYEHEIGVVLGSSLVSNQRLKELSVEHPWLPYLSQNIHGGLSDGDWQSLVSFLYRHATKNGRLSSKVAFVCDGALPSHQKLAKMPGMISAVFHPRKWTQTADASQIILVDNELLGFVRGLELSKLSTYLVSKTVRYGLLFNCLLFAGVLFVYFPIFRELLAPMYCCFIETAFEMYLVVHNLRVDKYVMDDERKHRARLDVTREIEKLQNSDEEGTSEENEGSIPRRDTTRVDDGVVGEDAE